MGKGTLQRRKGGRHQPLIQWRRIVLAMLLLGVSASYPTTATASPLDDLVPTLGTDGSGDADTASQPQPNTSKDRSGTSSAIKLVLILGLASLAPALILTCTCWIRFMIVFSFLRSGLGTQGAPPSQVLVGLSLFMTVFVMAPVANEIQTKAVSPYLEGTITEKEALAKGTPALRRFLLERTRAEDLRLFYEVSREKRPATADDVPLRIAIPAFVLSELGTAFRMGLVLLLPFLAIELVVAAVLSALGMIMLPPPVVSLPIKILLFVVVDGWHLIVGSLLRGAM